MRVLERGVGETQACGTGCCAAALATALRRGPEAPTQWVVDIPGGTVIVGLDGVIDWSGESPRITDASVFLTGPATRVAEIRLP
jgi:diaminopimelate epimerase